MTTDELKAFLDENKADIQAAIKAKMIESLLANHRWEISAEISKTVEAFVASEIVPEVKKALADQKGAILEACLVGAAEIGNTVAKGMAEHAAKNLAPDSYRFRQVMEALFK